MENNKDKTTIDTRLTINRFHYNVRYKKFTKNEVIYKCTFHKTTCKDVRIYINQENLKKIENKEPDFEYDITGYHDYGSEDEFNQKNNIIN